MTVQSSTDTDVDTEDQVDDEDEQLEDDESTPEEDEKLGPAGKRALVAERRSNRALKRELARLKPKKRQQKEPEKDTKTTTTTDTPDRVSIAAEVREELEREYTERYAMKDAETLAISLLSKAGFKHSPERGVRMLDLEDVIVDGAVDKKALREAVEELQDEEAQMFRRKRSTEDSDDDDEDEDDTPRKRSPARRQTGSADNGRKNPVVKTKTAAQLLASKRFGASKK